MNKLSTAERVSVVAALVEGNSVNSTVRLTGISKPTILKLLADLGTACAEHHNATVRNLTCERIQVDETWTFTYAKNKNLPEDKKGKPGFGDTWTWTAIDADTKLIVSYLVGGRSGDYAEDFMWDVAERLSNRVQLTSDGHNAYLVAVQEAFGNEIDYAQLIKIYGPERVAPGRYSPPVCIGAETKYISGNPEVKHISTSYAERSNLTMRMCMRRFTRLTNGFSKKIQNHAHMVAIFFAYYNFCRVHMTTKKTPAMASGLTDRIWKIDDLIGLLAGN